LRGFIACGFLQETRFKANKRRDEAGAKLKLEPGIDVYLKGNDLSDGQVRYANHISRDAVSGFPAHMSESADLFLGFSRS
jgi:hypothetical protein